MLHNYLRAGRGLRDRVPATSAIDSIGLEQFCGDEMAIVKRECTFLMHVYGVFYRALKMQPIFLDVYLTGFSNNVTHRM